MTLARRRRRDDDDRELLWRLLWWWERAVPLASIIIALIAVMNASEAANNAERIAKTASARSARAAVNAALARETVARQQEGRRIALVVLCGGIRGVAEGGRQALEGRLTPQSSMTRLSRRARRRAADKYVALVTKGVIDQAGVQAKDVVDAHGRLDCDAVQRLARIQRNP